MGNRAIVGFPEIGGVGLGMFLESIRVANYRSIENLTLVPCGAFNVLIGKNSSGKSNILTSIDAFFASIRPTVINTNPPVGDQIDFFQRKTETPIAIAATFQLSKEERSQLLNEIADEKPQVRNLLDNIEPDLRLSVDVLIKSDSSKRFAFVQCIRLLPRDVEDGHLLFEVSGPSAEELYETQLKLEQSAGVEEALERFVRVFDSDEYSTSRGRRRDVGIPSLDYRLRQAFGGGDIPPGIMSKVISLFQSSENYNSFVTSINALGQDTSAEVQKLSSRPIAAPIKTLSGEERIVPDYVNRLLVRIFETKILHFRERRVPIGSEEAKRLLQLKVRRGGTEQLARIQSTVTELLGVRVDAFEGTPGRRGEVTAELDVDQFLIQVNGSGIREALRLILDTEFEKPKILLVEEPEIHLHPALETSVMSYSREVSSQAQVFVTTHSTNFLDTGNFENVFLITKDRSTAAAPLTLSDAEAKLPSELGIRLSSLFMYDKIIFVEGPSDEQIVREFARSLEVNFGQLNLGFIQMRGVRNIGHYAAAEVVSFLTKRRVKLWFLVDKDESDSIHFARLKEDFGQNASIHVLSKREIENYLLSPKANIRYIAARRRRDAQFTPPSEDEFSKQLLSTAESLKPLAIWKRVRATVRKPIYPGQEPSSPPEDADQMIACAKEMLEGMQACATSAIENVKKACDNAVA
jgi:energy-coupling factor transporter ATP-binding protein EcfA2